MLDPNPDDLIRRLEADPLDPDLLRGLNQAAWAAFHDPWETPLPPPSTLLRRGRLPLEGEPMPEPEDRLTNPQTPEMLTPDLLDALLAELELTSYSRPSGDRLVHWAYDAESDREVTLCLWLRGMDEDTFVWHSVSDRRVPPGRIPEALRLCNQWNMDKLGPRAYLDLPPCPEEVDPDGWNPSGALTLDFTLPLPHGIHREALMAAFKRITTWSWRFWKLAHEDFGL